MLFSKKNLPMFRWKSQVGHSRTTYLGFYFTARILVLFSSSSSH